MIVSVYKGALGNQLFEAMTGYALALENNDEYYINPNLELARGQGNSIKHYVDSIFKNIPKTSYHPKNYFMECGFRYSKIPYSPDLILDGHFQSDKYFSKYKKEINEILEFDTLQETTNDCVIHVRTGDFLQLSEFSVVTPKYFHSAIRLVIDKNSNVEFKVVSDDYNLAEKYLPRYLKYSCLEGDELDHLKIMSRSDFVIMSNSTFSWWGSYLGKDKTTIVPDKWHNSDIDFTDIYREDMIRLPIM